ncbi:phosphoadenylyl-sulfate reductase [Brevundimonas sp. NPDC090276]|uniref:phosphoadenylyl-sulfate reductase n=1 Tax=Brevundimonas sp. NPDC090276 TaxID=3363956 RepID=UPI00383BD720
MQLLEQAQDGVRLSVSTPEEDIRAAAAANDSLILEFEAFRDGRGFSLAAILRGQGYQGRLIAAGKVLPDQVRHLRRCGFDAVELAPGADPAPWRRMDQVFSAAYQPASGDDRLVWRQRHAAPANDDAVALAARLNDQWADADAEDLLRAVLDPALGRKAAAISSFGAEAAVLLHLISRVRPDLPVVFLETGQHFFQTLAYRRELADRLGLTDVRDITPDPAALSKTDPRGDLWRSAPDACCDVRKVQPLAQAVAGFDTRITGRKRYQNSHRAALAPFEAADGVLTVNPLAAWSAEQIEDWLRDHQLPRHSLVAQGYPSIGCWPCTRAVEACEDARDGRWSGQEKTECGIHARVLAPAC